MSGLLVSSNDRDYTNPPFTIYFRQFFKKVANYIYEKCNALILLNIIANFFVISEGF